MGKHSHKQLLQGQHAYSPEDFTSIEHAVAFDRFRKTVENEIHQWAKDGELRRTFIDALASAWREYNDREPSDVQELKQFVDEYLKGMGEANIWRLAFVEGLTASLLDEVNEAVIGTEGLSPSEQRLRELIVEYFRSLGPVSPLTKISEKVHRARTGTVAAPRRRRRSAGPRSAPASRRAKRARARVESADV